MRKCLFLLIILIFVVFSFFMSEIGNFNNNVLFSSINILHEQETATFKNLGYTKKDETLLKNLFTKNELAIILNKQIPKEVLFPYLQHKAFELNFIEEYEVIRTNKKTSHFVAVNLYNHPYLTSEFYIHIRNSINTNNTLLLVNKNYQLEKDFTPNNLVLIKDLNTVIPGDYPRNYIKEEVYTSLKNLFHDGKIKGLSLFVSSGYRSFNTQEKTYKYYQYHSNDADKISARAGHSEHQTGLAIDLTCKDVNYQLNTQFENTKEGQFVRDNAYKYGFIIRYQKNKEQMTGYQYEPWHIRYVGKDVSQIIHKYELSLEEYLMKYTDMPK